VFDTSFSYTVTMHEVVSALLEQALDFLLIAMISHTAGVVWPCIMA